MPLQPGSAPCMAMVVPAAAVKRNHEVDEEGGSSSEPVKSDVSPVVRVKSPNGPPWSHWTTLELKTVAPAIRQASVRSWTSGTPVELRVCGHVAWQEEVLADIMKQRAIPDGQARRSTIIVHLLDQNVFVRFALGPAAFGTDRQGPSARSRR